MSLNFGVFYLIFSLSIVQIRSEWGCPECACCSPPHAPHFLQVEQPCVLPHCTPLVSHVRWLGLPCICLQQPPLVLHFLWKTQPHMCVQKLPTISAVSPGTAALRADVIHNALLAPHSPGKGAACTCIPVAVPRAPWLILDVETPCLSLSRFPVLPGGSPGRVTCRSA